MPRSRWSSGEKDRRFAERVCSARGEHGVPCCFFGVPSCRAEVVGLFQHPRWFNEIPPTSSISQEPSDTTHLTTPNYPVLCKKDQTCGASFQTRSLPQMAIPNHPWDLHIYMDPYLAQCSMVWAWRHGPPCRCLERASHGRGTECPPAPPTPRAGVSWRRPKEARVKQVWLHPQATRFKRVMKHPGFVER